MVHEPNECDKYDNHGEVMAKKRTTVERSRENSRPPIHDDGDGDMLCI